MVAITRRIEVDYGHRVPNHQGKCFNFHGHRGVIEATFVLDDGSTQQFGAAKDMVLDFSFVKQLMTETIDWSVDHGMILSVDDPWLVRMLPISLQPASDQIIGAIRRWFNDGGYKRITYPKDNPRYLLETNHWSNNNDGCNYIYSCLDNFYRNNEGTLFDLKSERSTPKLYVIQDSPTAEVLAQHFLIRLNVALDECIRKAIAHEIAVPEFTCCAVRWWETPNCSAIAQHPLWMPNQGGTMRTG